MELLQKWTEAILSLIFHFILSIFQKIQVKTVLCGRVPLTLLHLYWRSHEKLWLQFIHFEIKLLLSKTRDIFFHIQSNCQFTKSIKNLT